MKKLITVMIAVSAILIGCTNGPENSKQNLELIEKYVQSVENLDYETMEAVLDDNYMGYGPSINDSITKNLAVENWKQNVEFLYESIKYEKSRNAWYVPKSCPE